MDIGSIKYRAKAAFKENYWRCVAVAFILGLLTLGTGAATGREAADSVDDTTIQNTINDLTNAINALTEDEKAIFFAAFFGSLTMISIISILLRIFLFNPLEVGGYRFFKKNIEFSNTDIGTIAEGFGNYGHTFMTLLLRDIFTLLWTLLLVIPGIIKSYSYMLVPYLIKDNPNLSATDTIALSKEMMRGHKLQAFVLDLSFIGWYLLGFITLGLVNFFWTVPYHYSAQANFYREVSKHYGTIR